jgi:hypothetical protein
MEHFEFDPKKSQINKERHGIDLAWAQGLWDETHIIIPAKNVSGESRYLIVAKVGDRCYAAIFTKRGEAIRLISCHRADRQLERIYEGYVQGQEDQ